MPVFQGDGGGGDAAAHHLDDAHLLFSALEAACEACQGSGRRGPFGFTLVAALVSPLADPVSGPYLWAMLTLPDDGDEGDGADTKVGDGGGGGGDGSGGGESRRRSELHGGCLSWPLFSKYVADLRSQLEAAAEADRTARDKSWIDSASSEKGVAVATNVQNQTESAAPIGAGAASSLLLTTRALRYRHPKGRRLLRRNISKFVTYVVVFKLCLCQTCCLFSIVECVCVCVCVGGAWAGRANVCV